jgi:hypothetical protein
MNPPPLRPAPSVASGTTEDGGFLLCDVEEFISRFVILPPGALLPAALWTMGTHCYGTFETYGYLALVSPEKGCAKTRLTKVLGFLVAEPILSVGISAAALFRVIEARAPTLILDEAEVLKGKDERAGEIRALLNAGNGKGVTVPRCVGQSHEIAFFNVFCPKILCAIRRLPDTITDRSIVVSMQRKQPSEKIARLITRRAKPEGEALHARIAAWIRSSRQTIASAYESLPDDEFLSDRALDIAEPLISILTVADPSRLDELRGNLKDLMESSAANDQENSLSLKLLADIRSVWPQVEDRIFTSELLRKLKDIEDGPWCSAETKLDARKLSRFVRPYGITPQTVRIGDSISKGYLREPFETVFARYLALYPLQPLQPA